MSKKQKQQYIYNQQMYEVPNTTHVDYGAYQATNYKQTKKTNPQEVVYQQEYVDVNQPQYIIEGNNYIPQVQYVNEGEYITNDQGEIIYDYKQEGDLTGYEQQIYQQPEEQIIYQDQQGQPIQQYQIYEQDQGDQQYLQYEHVYEQNPQVIQQQERKAKYTNQMVKQKPNIQQNPQYYQVDFVSRNPNMQQKYIKQNQNIPQQYIQNIQEPKYVPQPQKPIQKEKIMVQQDKPLLDSQFAPDFQLANSIIDQSQIPVVPKQVKKNY